MIADILSIFSKFIYFVAFGHTVIWRQGFLHFCICRFQNSDGEIKYLQLAEELIRPERNTLVVSFVDLEQFNQQLSTTIQEEFYRYGILIFK